MSNIQSFDFQQKNIRVLNRDGNAWFVAVEVAEMLGYRDSHNLTRLLDDDEADTHEMSVRSKNGVVQSRQIQIISESGFYHAAFKSTKTEAKIFRKWVTSEVLPTIRKTGGYAQTISLEQQQAIKDLIHRVVSESGKTHGELYARLHNRFKIPRYQELPQLRFEEAMAYLKAKLPQAQLFYGLRDGRYLLKVSQGEVLIRDLAQYSVVDMEQVNVVRQNLKLISQQMHVFSGDVGNEVLGRVPVLLEQQEEAV